MGTAGAPRRQRAAGPAPPPTRPAGPAGSTTGAPRRQRAAGPCASRRLGLLGRRRRRRRRQRRLRRIRRCRGARIGGGRGASMRPAGRRARGGQRRRPNQTATDTMRQAVDSEADENVDPVVIPSSSRRHPEAMTAHLILDGSDTMRQAGSPSALAVAERGPRAAGFPGGEPECVRPDRDPAPAAAPGGGGVVATGPGGHPATWPAGLGLTVGLRGSHGPSLTGREIPHSRGPSRRRPRGSRAKGLGSHLHATGGGPLLRLRASKAAAH